LYLSKTCSGKYFVSFQCEVEIKPLPQSKNIIGIDLGLKDLVITSDALKIPNKKFAKSLDKELKYAQKQLSKNRKDQKTVKRQESNLLN